MRTTTLVATCAVALVFVDSLAAQRDGGGGGGRNRRRSEEITNRVGAFFSEINGPETKDEKVADLNTIELVRAATAAGQVVLLYLHDGAAPENVVQGFEAALFRSDMTGDELGLKLRCFHCAKIDISKVPALKDRFGKDVPLFVAFDKEGKEQKPVSMAGYKADPKELEGLLVKAAKGAFKPPLESFAKKYADFVRDLEKVLAAKATAEADLAKAGQDKAKAKKAEKELVDLKDEEQKLLEAEKKLTETVRLPERGSKRIGGGRPDRGGQGNTGRGNTGSGNTGRGNTGG